MAFVGSRRALLSGGGNPVLAMLAKGRSGAWWTPQAGLIFTDAAGTTPATTNGDSIGLDKNKYALGTNDASQSSATLKPKLQAGPVSRFDGVDDYWATGLNPATTMTLIAKFFVASGGPFVILGSRVNSSTTIGIGVNTSGTLQGLVGSQSFGSGGVAGAISGLPVIYGSVATGVLTANGTKVNLYVNSSVIYSGTQVGVINTTIPLMIGAFNNNGAAVNNLNGDVYHAIASVGYAATPNEVRTITQYLNT